MIRQALKQAVLAMLALAGGIHCDGSAPRTPRPPEASPMRTDLEALRKYIALPAGDFRCKWQVRAVAPSSMAPGPTDASLVAVVELSEQAWTAIALAPPETEETIPPARDNEIILSDALAKQLLPEHILKLGQRFDDTHVTLRGSPLSQPQLSRSSWQISRAIRIGDALLLMAATS